MLNSQKQANQKLSSLVYTGTTISVPYGKLTHQSDPDPYIRMMQKVYQFSAYVYDEDLEAMQKFLETCNAFLEHKEGKLKIIER
jgi:hypothetical protein